MLSAQIASRAKPGQFIMVRVTNFLDPLLRRPFGIHRVCQESGTHKEKGHLTCVEILYRIAGKGTLMLSEKKRGEEIDVIGPLGNGFNLRQHFKTAIIVAGGIGVAPLLSLTHALKKLKGTRAKHSSIVFIGGETRGDILCVKDFKKLGATVEVSTEDGSMGTKGVVTTLLRDFLRTTDHLETRDLKLFACGPSPMLRTVSDIARAQNISCEISLENKMACGVGACLGCSIPAKAMEAEKRGIFYQRVCTDGPVFDSRTILWS